MNRSSALIAARSLSKVGLQLCYLEYLRDHHPVISHAKVYEIQPVMCGLDTVKMDMRSFRNSRVVKQQRRAALKILAR